MDEHSSFKEKTVYNYSNTCFKKALWYTSIKAFAEKQKHISQLKGYELLNTLESKFKAILIKGASLWELSRDSSQENYQDNNKELLESEIWGFICLTVFILWLNWNHQWSDFILGLLLMCSWHSILADV